MTQAIFLEQSSGLADYVSCLYKKRAEFSAEKCQKLVSFCGDSAQTSTERMCPVLGEVTRRLLSNTRFGGEETISSIVRDLMTALLSEGSFTSSHPELGKLVYKFVKRDMCFSRARERVRKCLPKAKETCEKRSLRVLEVNRMKMEDMDFIIDAFPDIHVIYYTRDPRAISLSRAQWDFPKGKRDRRAIAEARYLCPRMTRDISELLRIQSEYPGIIHHLRYEDFVASPVEKGKEAFRYFERTPSKQWKFFCEQAMHAKKREKYRVSNTTHATLRWMKEIPESDLVTMDSLCGDVLDYLGYKRFEGVKAIRSLL